MPDQAHGKRFEDFIKACGLFPGSSDTGRSPTSDFDIEAHFDRKLGLPTSIKSTGSRTIALSDARRFFSQPGPYRMIVGRYWQIGDQKHFREVHEFILSVDTLSKLKGEIAFEEVKDFHDGLSLVNFPLGEHRAARAWARQQKNRLSSKATQIVLNPKIGSDSQRRLQCSVSLDAMIEAATSDNAYTLHQDAIGNFALPIIQHSPKRR